MFMQSEGQMVESFGGVLANARGQFLLQRSETDFFGDLPWTFVKGPSKQDETPDQTALRVVFEETGYQARIIAALGNYDGPAPASDFSAGSLEGIPELDVEGVTEDDHDDTVHQRQREQAGSKLHQPEDAEERDGAPDLQFVLRLVDFRQPPLPNVRWNPTTGAGGRQRLKLVDGR